MGRRRNFLRQGAHEPTADRYRYPTARPTLRNGIPIRVSDPINLMIAWAVVITFLLSGVP